MITTIQTEVKNHLDAQNFFSDALLPIVPPATSALPNPNKKPITVLIENLKDLNSEIAIAIAQLGLLVLVRAPQFSSSTTSPYPCYDKIQIVCRVFEVPLTNRDSVSAGTCQPAGLVAEAIAFHLCNHTLTATGNKLIKPTVNQGPDAGDFVTYDVTLTTAATQPTAPIRI